jgi:tetratricopeptide (TPR) repeat protein
VIGMKSVFAAAGLSVFLLACSAPPLAAAPDAAHAAQLDQLFQALKNAKTETDGLAIEGQIVAVWLESGDPKIDQQMQWAVAAMDANSWELALNYLNGIILNKPDYAEGWNKRATLYFFIGQYDASLSDIAHTLALEPRHFGAIAGMGMIMQALGEDEKALAAYKQALTIDPQLTNIQLEVFLLEDKLKGKRI